MIEKDFLEWTILKEKLENKKNVAFFAERDVFWCHCGQNIGFEQDGKSKFFTRPVIILRKISNHLFIGIPTSTKIKDDIDFYCKFLLNGKERSALLLQVRAFDSKRLESKIGRLDKHMFHKIKEAMNTNILCL